MAHTLTLTDTAGPTTIDLATTGSTAGIKLLRYAPAESTHSVGRSSSLYGKGAFPVYAKAENVIDTIVLAIYGSSPDDVISRVRSLTALIYRARTLAMNDYADGYVLLEHKPQSSTNAGRVLVFNGRLDLPASYQEDSNWVPAGGGVYVLENVILTLEREPYFRGDAITIADLSGASRPNSSDFVTPSADVTGDVHAEVAQLYMLPQASTPTTVIVGYASKQEYGGRYSQANFGVQAATLWANYSPDASSVADAAAISGNTMQVTFASYTSMYQRNSSDDCDPWGEFRVWARVRNSAGSTVCKIKCEFDVEDGPPHVSNTVEVTSTTYKWLDLGPIFVDPAEGSSYTSCQLWAQRVSGAAYLMWDSIFLMPTKQLLKASFWNSQLDFNNTYGRPRIRAASDVAGNPSLAPGPGRLYILSYDANSEGYAVDDFRLVFKYSPMYNGNRGTT